MQVQIEKPRMEKQLKIGIVGPEESKWTEEQKVEAKIKINQLLNSLDCNINPEDKNFTYKGIVLVSGHCPVGEERWYCLDCQMFIENKNYVNHKRNNTDGIIKVFDQGGVDTWAEIIATELGIQKEIYPVEVNQWEDYEDCTRNEFGVKDVVIRKGFHSRNIQIAEASDVLYDIEPKGSCKHCGGKGKVTKVVKGVFSEYDGTAIEICRYCLGTGNYSGGTWTMRYAEKLGKETHLVVIE